MHGKHILVWKTKPFEKTEKNAGYSFGIINATDMVEISGFLKIEIESVTFKD